MIGSFFVKPQSAQTHLHCARCCGNRGTNFPSINKGMQDSGLGAVDFPVRIAGIAPIAGVDNINQNVKVAPVDGRKGWAKLKQRRSEVGRVIRQTGQPGRLPDPKKPTASARNSRGLELRKQ